MKHHPKFAACLASTLALSLTLGTLPTPAAAIAFTDVDSGSWYYSYVEDMSNLGYVSGTTSTQFQPMNSLSVAEFSTMLANAFYGETLGQIPSSTVWWESFLTACYQRNGLVGTVAEQSSQWSTVATQPISRYDMAMMVDNLLVDRQITPLSDLEISQVLSTLPDQIPLAYQKAVASAYYHGFLTGSTGGAFLGDQSLNRAQASVVLSALVHSPMIATERTNSAIVTPSLDTTTPEVTTPEAYITADRAKEIALAHAGVSASSVTFVKCQFEYDNGVPEYEVEFYVGYNEYDYEINAITGAILSYDFDMETVHPGTSTTPDTSTYITADRAKEIALAHAGVSASSVTFVKCQFEYDNGVPEYEVEFYVGYNEYDYEINAITGAILSYDFDMETVHPGTSTTPDTSTYITADRAKEIALAHAGVSATSVTFVKCQFEYDNGIPEYEVEFYVGYNEYDYEINAITGSILSYDFDMETVHPGTSTTPDTSTYITADRAKEIALAHAGVSATSVTFVKCQFEYDNGVPEYEVEFYVGYNEYDYEINAITGAILSYDFDMETVHPGTSTTPDTSTYITADRAKEIALAHAGLSSSQVSSLKCEFDFDDGRAEYEVEFKVGKVEYEYEISATTGTILSYDRDS